MKRRPIASALAVCGAILACLAIACVAGVVRGAVAAIAAEATAGGSPQVAAAIMGEALVQIAVISTFAIPAFLLLTTALTLSRYRAPWFFWFVCLSSFALLFVFPLGTAFGIFFFVYAFLRRHEFRHAAALPTVA